MQPLLCSPQPAAESYLSQGAHHPVLRVLRDPPPHPRPPGQEVSITPALHNLVIPALTCTLSCQLVDRFSLSVKDSQCTDFVQMPMILSSELTPLISLRSSPSCTCPHLTDIHNLPELIKTFPDLSGPPLTSTNLPWAQTLLPAFGCPTHWSLKAEGCLKKSLKGRLHVKDRSWRGLQFGVCGDNIHWRKRQLNEFYFLQLEWSKIFIILAILYFFLACLWP